MGVRSVFGGSPVYIKQIPVNNGPDTTSWLNGGGVILTDPQLATGPGTNVYLTALAGGGTVYLLPFNVMNQQYGTWTFTGGILNDETIATLAGNIYIAGRDSANRIYWYNQTANSWYFAGGAGVSSTTLTGAK